MDDDDSDEDDIEPKNLVLCTYSKVELHKFLINIGTLRASHENS